MNVVRRFLPHIYLSIKTKDGNSYAFKVTDVCVIDYLEFADQLPLLRTI
ncbi:hypothetical protein LEP1GSC175_1278 [Leptospira santarosai str. HAI821]|nr:hypothetical protein LEP1GSC175_1278 [Leptospira santarosai str. HAI821]EPG83028.1 hypothetical protein LEP1GSC048_3359 [Leptospira santarosai serovar Shermani str. 1342KT]